MMGQMTVFSGAERRRRWSIEQKRAIVDAAFMPGAVVAEIARAAELGANQIYRWRRELGGLQVAPDGFAAVRIAPDRVVTETLSGMVMVIEVGGAVLKISGHARPALVTAALRVLR